MILNDKYERMYKVRVMAYVKVISENVHEWKQRRTLVSLVQLRVDVKIDTATIWSSSANR